MIEDFDIDLLPADTSDLLGEIVLEDFVRDRCGVTEQLLAHLSGKLDLCSHVKAAIELFRLQHLIAPFVYVL